MFRGGLKLELGVQSTRETLLFLDWFVWSWDCGPHHRWPQGPLQPDTEAFDLLLACVNCAVVFGSANSSVVLPKALSLLLFSQMTTHVCKEVFMEERETKKQALRIWGESSNRWRDVKQGKEKGKRKKGILRTQSAIKFSDLWNSENE